MCLVGVEKVVFAGSSNRKFINRKSGIGKIQETYDVWLNNSLARTSFSKFVKLSRLIHMAALSNLTPR